MLNIHTHRKLLIWPLAIAVVLAVLAGVWFLTKQPKTDIRTANPGIEDFAAGRTTDGTNDGSAKELVTASKLTYESAPRTTHSDKTNVIGIIWEQEGEGLATVEMRTRDGNGWSRWVGIGGGEDRKDGTAETHSGVLLTENAREVQYRFVLAADASGRSPVVRNPRLSLIDSTRGPDPTKKNLLSRVFGNHAKATATGPSIFTRMDWGCPEGDSSPRWNPEYIVPDEVIVHHTAAVTSPNSSAATIRGIWDFHANTQGWGDIGYNYLVDLNGRIWQGRFFNQSYAKSIKRDVAGGHTLAGHNFHSVGVAALGNFTNQGVSGAMLDGIGKIAGWKAMPYGTWNPNGRTFGHRDAYSTNCPGNNLYNSLNTVRHIAGANYDFYSKWEQFDYSYQGQGVGGSPGTSLGLKTGQTTTAYVDLRNDGTSTWSNQQVRLGTWNPRDRISGFRHNSWINGARAATFAGKVVSGSVQAASEIAPGETARFPFTVQNQGAAAGTYAEYFQPVAEGYTWFIRDVGMHWQMTSIPDIYSYQWMGQTYGVPTEPAQTGSVRVDAKNTGNVDWKNTGPNPVRIGTYQPRDRGSNLYHGSWINGTRPATFAGRLETGGSVTTTDTITPGQTARFEFTVQAPDYPFVGNEYFNLVAEGITWMNDVGIYWPVSIPQNYQAQWAGQSAPPTIDKSDGGIGSLYFDYKNTGSYPWRKGSIVKLAPSNPIDRASRFFATGLSGGQLPANTANWMSATRVGSFAGQVTGGVLDTSDTVIEPGSTGRFYAALDARSVDPGSYREYFRIVAEKFAWLQDYGAFLDVTVVP